MLSLAGSSAGKMLGNHKQQPNIQLRNEQLVRLVLVVVIVVANCSLSLVSTSIQND